MIDQGLRKIKTVPWMNLKLIFEALMSAQFYVIFFNRFILYHCNISNALPQDVYVMFG